MITPTILVLSVSPVKAFLLRIRYVMSSYAGELCGQVDAYSLFALRTASYESLHDQYSGV